MDPSSKKPLSVTTLALGLLAAAIVVGLAASLYRSRDSVLGRQDSQPLTENSVTSASLSPSSYQSQIITVEAGSFYFNPNTIRVKQGQPVRLELKAVDMMHDFVVDELGIRVPVTRSGDTNTIEFAPTQKGEFEFYCSVGDHRQKGQVGKLIVE